jgi:hypothetical protein
LLHKAVARLGQRINVANIRRTTGNIGVDESKAALVAAIDDEGLISNSPYRGSNSFAPARQCAFQRISFFG